MFDIERVSKKIIRTFKNGSFCFVIGCGGSASLSTHLSTELIGKFKKQRRALPCLSLTDNTSIITAIVNDFGGDFMFSRQLEAFGKKGDLLITMSTSGTSPSILNAKKRAREMGINVISFPTNLECGSETDVTQNYHLELIHGISEIVENAFI